MIRFLLSAPTPDKTLPRRVRVQRLCSRCSKINLEDLFQAGPRSQESFEGVNVKFLGALPTEDERARCAMCKLFVGARLYQKEPSQENYNVQAYSSALRSATLEIWETGSNSTHSCVLAVQHGDGRRISYAPRNLYDTSERLNDIGVIVAAESPIPEPTRSKPLAIYGCEVVPNRVQYDRLRQWLYECEQQHGSRCRAPQRDQKSPVRVIDCVSRTVVFRPPDSHYFALSYVWGPPDPLAKPWTLNGRPDSTELPARLHPAIGDGINVVLALGGHYIWVDQFCINQADEEEKKQEISRMDRIYAGADATIIAAGSQTGRVGLAGVGSISRLSQPQVFSQGKLFVSTLPPLRSALAQSNWISRGWTFQEACLSRRCLFFTDLQVYFTCMVSLECESIVTNFPKDHSGSRLSTTYAVLEHLDAVEPDPLLDSRMGGPPNWAFRAALSQYSRRTLSYDSDALNAFRGILQQSRQPSYWGIPFLFQNAQDNVSQLATLAGDANYRFACGLTWEPFINSPGSFRQQSLIRRASSGTLGTEFPSWSWAGWVGHVSYFSPHESCGLRGYSDYPEWDIVPKEDFGLRIWVKNSADGTLTAIADLLRSFHSQSQPQPQSQSQSQTQQSEEEDEAQPEIMVIPEISPVLRIDSILISTQIERRKEGGYFIQGSRGWESNVVFCEYPLQDSDLYGRVISEKWVGVVLVMKKNFVAGMEEAEEEEVNSIGEEEESSEGENSEEEASGWADREPSIYILLLDKRGGKIERFGSVWVSQEVFSSMEQWRETIELF